MQIRIVDAEDELTAARRAFVERRLFFAISRFAPKIKRITVELLRVPRVQGRPQQSCRITVRLPRSPDVCVTVVDVDVETAVARAAERTGRAVARSLERYRAADRPKTFSIR